MENDCKLFHNQTRSLERGRVCTNFIITFFVDCGKTFTIEHGYVDYTGHQSTYNHSLPIHCEPGYVLEGALYTTCQSDGTWTHNTICRIKGQHKTHSYFYTDPQFQRKMYNFIMKTRSWQPIRMLITLLTYLHMTVTTTQVPA